MIKIQFSRVQAQPGTLFSPIAGIQGITHDGVANLLHMNAQLMGATGLRKQQYAGAFLRRVSFFSSASVRNVLPCG